MPYACSVFDSPLQVQQGIVMRNLLLSSHIQMLVEWHFGDID